MRFPEQGGERLVEPNQVVNVGQKIFRIDAKGALEVHFDIPENLLKRVAVGMSGSVVFPGKQSPVAKCEISFLGIDCYKRCRYS